MPWCSPLASRLIAAQKLSKTLLRLIRAMISWKVRFSATKPSWSGVSLIRSIEAARSSNSGGVSCTAAS